AEPVVHVLPVPAVADPGQDVTGRIDAEPRESGYGARHQALAAGLVDGTGPGLDHHRTQACEAGLDRGRQPDRTAADDQDVRVAGHRAASSASARSSAGMRKRSSRTAFSTVKPRAVHHAEWTRGRASPSATTAT